MIKASEITLILKRFTGKIFSRFFVCRQRGFSSKRKLIFIALGIIVISLLLFVSRLDSGIAKEPQIVFQEARQWQIAADAPDTLTIRPDASGSTGLDTLVGAATHWEAVNEDPSEGDDNYVANLAKNATQYDLYNLANHTAEQGTINNITVYINIRQDSSKAATAATVIKTGATEDRGTATALTGTYVELSKVYTEKPAGAGGGAWSWSEIDSLQAGVELVESASDNSSDLRCTQVWVVVDYTPEIIVSGTVYTNEGVTTMGSGKTVRVKVNGGGSTYSTTTDSSGGYWIGSIPQPSADDILTVFLDTAGGEKAVTITKASSGDPIINLNLYQNRVIVRDQGSPANPITIADMAVYDNSDDSDIQFTATTTNGTATTTTIFSGNKLYVWPQKTFNASGTITVLGNAGGEPDGSLHIADGATLTACPLSDCPAGGEISVAGSWIASSSATFTHNNATTTFKATTTGKNIWIEGSSDFYQLEFNGSGGEWTFQDHATSTATTTITTGTLKQGTNIDLTLGGLYIETGTGVFTKDAGSGTLTFKRTADADPAVIDDVQADNNLGDVHVGISSGVADQNRDIIVDSFTVNSGSTHNTKGYEIDCGSSIIIYGTLNASDTKENDGTIIYLQTDWTNTGTFTAGDSTTTFDGTTEDNSINPGDSAFYNIEIDGTGGWEFESVSATATNNFFITQGTATSASEILYVGGSWYNAGTFIHNNATTTFNSADTGETINPGSSSYYNVDFNNAAGGWTITNDATSTNNWFLTNAAAASGFIVNSNVRIEVKGQFYSELPGTETTWNSGSLLYLNSATNYTANAKTVGDIYKTLQIGANTDIRIWNSTSSTYTVDSSSSLYSMDHDRDENGAGDNGYLYIWGDYHVLSSSTDYWSYATDFDGTAAANRQVHVRLAVNATATVEKIEGTFSEGWNSPSILVNDNSYGSSEWENPMRATSSDDYRASSTIPKSNGFSNYLKATGFNFSIVDGATITGIRASYERCKDLAPIKDKRISIVKDGSVGSQNKSAGVSWEYCASEFSSYYGGDGDLWGETWIPSDINSSDFGFVVSGECTSGLSDCGAFIDHMRLTVYYTFSTSSLEIIGTDQATTTIDRQGGSGDYTIKVDGGEINFEYYEIKNINEKGLQILGSPNITSLSYGDFELAIEGGTMMTVTSTAIDANTELTITGCSFSTTSDLNVAYNVTATGTASSFWFFSQHYGNLDGEAYDKDPGGDPGYIRWSDSATTTLTQWHYRWYENANQINPATPLIATNTQAINATSGTVFRLRVNIQIGSSQLDAGNRKFILQYASATDCSLVSESNWTEIGGLAANYTSVWRGYNNSTPDDGDTITSLLLVGKSDVLESYEETSPSVNNPNAIPAGQAGEWDWVLQYNAAYSSRTYCFRMAKANGNPFDGYANYPKIVTYQAATWKAAEDASGSAATNTDIRLRFQVINTGDATSTNYKYQIEYAARTGDTCGDETFIPMPVLNASTTALFEMTTSSFFRYQDPTTHQLSGTSTYPFNTGQLVETYATTGDMDVGDVSLSEAEYVFHISTTTSGGYYCFRLTNNGTALDNYNVYGVLYVGTIGVDISGTIYPNEGGTPHNCAVTPLTVTAKINGAGSYETTCTESNGDYTISSLTVSAGDVVTVFLNGETEKAVAVTKSINGNTNISGLDLYENRVILRSDNGVALTVENMAQYDNSDDPDIQFTATTTNGTATTTTIFSGNKLYIWPSQTFTPGGTVTVLGNAAGSPDGDFHIGTGATFNASTTTNVAGSWIASSSATFTHNDGTVTFKATATDKIIWIKGSSDFHNLTFNGSGGGWTFYKGINATATNNFTVTQGAVTSTDGTLAVGNNFVNSGGTFNATTGIVRFYATDAGNQITTNGSSFYNLLFEGSGGDWTPQDAVTVSNNLTMTAGTLQGTQNVTVNGGEVTGNGTITLTGGTFLLDNTGNFGGDSAWSFYNLTFGDGSDSQTTSKTGSGNIEVIDILTIDSSHVLNAGDDTWTLASSSVSSLPFVINGIFTAQTSLFKYTASTSVTISTTTYYKLELLPAESGSPTYTIQGGTSNKTLTTNDYLYIGDGTNSVTVTGNTNDPILNIGGNFEIRALATTTASDSADFSVGGNWSNAGRFNHSNATVTFNGTSEDLTIATDGVSHPFYNIHFDGLGGGWELASGNHKVENDFIITQGTVTSTSGILYVGGTWDNSGTFVAGGGNVKFYASGVAELITTGGTSNPFYNLTFVSEEGPNGPLFAENDTSVGTLSWDYPERIYKDDANTSNAGSDSDVITYYLKATDFGFSIPSGATVDGIQVDIDRYRFYVGGQTGLVFDEHVRIIQGGVIQSENKAKTSTAWPTSAAYTSYGGEEDLWSESWNVSDVNSSGFGVALSMDCRGSGYAFGSAGRVDYMRITVYYDLVGSSQGPNNPDELGVTGASWSNPSYATNTDNRKASDSIMGIGNSSNLRAVDFGFSIPEGSTIKGIEVGVEKSASVTTWIVDNAARIVKGGAPGSTDKKEGGSWPLSDTISTYGGSSDLWGESWLYSDINASNFGFDLVVTNNQIFVSNTAYVDHIKITVYYDLPSSNGWTFASGNHDIDNDFVNSSSTVTSTASILYIGSNWSNTGTFNHNNGTTTFDSASTGKTIAPGESPFYDVDFDNSGGGWEFLANATTANNLTITAGITTSTSGILAVGNNYLNAGTFTHNSGTVKFYATDSGNQITTNESDFYQLLFDGTGGGWTFQDHATSTATTTIAKGTLIQGTNIDLTLGGLYIETGTGAFTKDAGTGLLYFERTADADPSVIDDVQEDNNLGDVHIGYSPGVTNQNSDIIVDSFTVNLGDVHNTRGYEIDCASFITISGTLNASDTKEGDLTNIFLQTNWTNTGTFTAGDSTTTFDGGTENNTIAPGDSDFYSIVFDGAGGGWEFTSNSATATHDFFVLQGTATSASEMLYVGGSWKVESGSTFLHNNATTTFNSADTGETINPGSSSFYNVDFDKGTGGWTITNDATSTNNWFLTNSAAANGFIVNSNVRVEVKGQYLNELPGTETTWNSGSLLYLNSATAYTANSKTVGDIYETLQIGANTDIRMWNSTSSAYTVDSSGSLYSMDHDRDESGAGDDGYLYIWGDYHIPAGGTDYWCYDTDFDGTAGGRQAHVRFAANSTTTFDAGETLHATGTDVNTSTTIDVQESGTYAIKVDGGILNMYYYQIRNINENGLWLTGSPTITDLSYGDYGYNIEGGTMIKVASAVIDANNLKTFTGCEFSTTSDLNTVYNVTEVGAPASYWTFSSHTGNLDGENYDNDPGDVPGYIRWDDSGITVSGIIYTNEGVTAFNCVGDNLTVKIELNGAGDYTDVCTAGDGSYSMTVPVGAANDVLTAFVDGHGSFRAVVVTKASSSDDNIAGLDLYQNRVIVRHEDAPADPITIPDMDYYDADDDSDVQFRATTTDLDMPAEGEATSTTIFAGNKLYIWPGKTFNASGSIKILGNGGSEPDGSLHIAEGATFTACPSSYCPISSVINVSGSWIASSTATFNSNDAGVTFKATTTGKNIWTEGSSDFYRLGFHGAGGEWTLKSDSATVTDDIGLIEGTVTSTSGILYVGGDWQCYGGIFDHNSGTVLFNATDEGYTIEDGGSPFNLITFNGVGGTWFYQDGASVSPATTTVQNGTSTFLNAKAGGVKVTGGYLLVDWYLGAHLVDASTTATNIDTDDCHDITISEESASSTIWGYIKGTGWDGPYNSTTTGTGLACGGDSGINPQPGSTTAIRIREYKKTASETFYYKYNIKVEWQTNYGEYDYYDDYGGNYLTSASSTVSSGVDKVITETWYRTSSSIINSPYTCSAGSGNQCINQPPDNGSWYVGMRPGLLFEITTGLNVDFGELNSTNNWTAKASSTLEVTTSASNGYVVTAWAINEARMKIGGFDIYISKYDTKNDSPKEWNQNCTQNSSCCGFGFTTDDSSLSGGTANRFTSGSATCSGAGASGVSAYSGFATSTETVAFNPVADLSNPTTTDKTIITYKISVDSAQAAGNYQTTVIYICTANY